MTKTMYWIDDTQKSMGRQTPSDATKENFKKSLNVELKVLGISASSQFDTFVTDLDEKATYAVMIDYQLVKVGAGNRTEYGTTWAAQLRAFKPAIPIIGLSSERESSIPRFRMENFLAFFHGII